MEQNKTTDTFVCKGKLIYNRVVAEGTSQRGEWKRSEVVIETIRANGQTACRVFTIWGVLDLPLHTMAEWTYVIVENKYPDRNGNERSYKNARITDYEVTNEKPDILSDKNDGTLF